MPSGQMVVCRDPQAGKTELEMRFTYRFVAMSARASRFGVPQDLFRILDIGHATSPTQGRIGREFQGPPVA